MLYRLLLGITIAPWSNTDADIPAVFPTFFASDPSYMYVILKVGI